MTGVETAAPARRRRWPALLALVLVVAVGGWVLAARLGGPATAPAALVGRPAPALQGTTLDGTRFDLADWRGQVVLVNLWASWCPPCRDEAPVLAAAQQALAPRGLRVVGIDVKDDAGAARGFLADNDATGWPSVADPDGGRAVQWGTLALPESYLVGPDGTVVAKATGELDARWIDQHVVPLLPGRAP